MGKIIVPVCLKHSIYLKHGIKRGYPVRWYRQGYHLNKHGYFSHCEKCLLEIEKDFYGEKLFDENGGSVYNKT